MSVLPCGGGRHIDRYASAKSLGEFSLALSLIADDIKDMYQFFQVGEGSVEYFWVLVVITAISLTLQSIALTFALMLFINRVPKEPPKTASDVSMHNVPQSVSDSTSRDDLAVRYDSGDSSPADPMPAIALRRLNDGLTVITLLVAIMHVIKNVMKPGLSVNESV